MVWSALPRLTIAAALQQQRVGAGAAVDRGFIAVVVTVSLPPPAAMTSAPPPPSMVSLPEPVVIVLTDDEPVTTSAAVSDAGVQVLEIRDADAVAGGLVRAGGDREVDRGDAAGGGKDQRIGSDIAVDRDFSAVVGYDVVAATGD